MYIYNNIKYIYIYIYTYTLSVYQYILIYYIICKYLQYPRFVVIVFEPMLWVNIRLLISTFQRNRRESPVGASDPGNNMCWSFFGHLSF